MRKIKVTKDDYYIHLIIPEEVPVEDKVAELSEADYITVVDAFERMAVAQNILKNSIIE